MKPSTIALIALGACTVPDGDLASVALLKMNVEASNDTLDQRLSRVTGEVTVAYTSTELLELEILDNGISVFANSYAVERGLTVTVDAEVGLLFEELNNLSVSATYNGDTVTTSLPVTVPSSLQAFSLIPSVTAVDELAVEVIGHGGTRLCLRPAGGPDPPRQRRVGGDT